MMRKNMSASSGLPERAATPKAARRLIAGIALAIAASTAACTVRGSGYVGASTTPVVYTEPPAPQVETQTVERPGYLWVHGRWDWQNGQWQWIGGHWEHERAGYAWSEGRWERRGNSWHWIDGTWSVSATTTTTNATPDNPTGWHSDTPGPANGGAPMGDGGGAVTVTVNGGMYPTAAPPPMRVENPGAARGGYLWIAGRWDWQQGQWTWVAGHWERERANMQWYPGRWELQGNYYVWVEGRWDRPGAPVPAAGPVVRDHR